MTITFWNAIILDEIIANHILKSRELRVNRQFGFTLRFGTVASSVPYLTLQWHVCRFLTSAKARNALPRPTSTVSPFQVLHYTPLVRCLSHGQSVACETWKLKVIHFPFLTFLTPSPRILFLPSASSQSSLAYISALFLSALFLLSVFFCHFVKKRSPTHTTRPR